MHNAIAHHMPTHSQSVPEQQCGQPPQFNCWASMTPYGTGYPFGHSGQLSWLCPIPTPAAPPACSLARQCEKLNSPWLCVSTALQQLKRWCYRCWVSSKIQSTASYKPLCKKPKHLHPSQSRDRVCVCMHVCLDVWGKSFPPSHIASWPWILSQRDTGNNNKENTPKSIYFDYFVTLWFLLRWVYVFMSHSFLFFLLQFNGLEWFDAVSAV